MLKKPTRRMNREATKIRRKSELLAISKRHKIALIKELNLSADRAVNFGKNMAIIGGVLFVGYTVLDRFLEARLKTESKTDKPNKFATLNKIILPLLSMALQQGSSVLLKRVRNMLIDYLEEKNNDDV